MGPAPDHRPPPPAELAGAREPSPSPDPLRTSLAEQLRRLRGAGALPEPLLDVVRETVDLDGGSLTVLRPRDWDELRHQEGAAGRSAPYWAHLWPSAVALGRSLSERRLTGCRVLELGCGLGLPAMVAARAGADVLATDGSPDAVVYAAHNLAVNGLEGEVAQADWRAGAALAQAGPWDVVLAADVLYLRHNVEALVRLLPRLVAAGGEALMADPGRAGARDFLAAARHAFSLHSRPAPEHEGVLLHRLQPRPGRPGGWPT